jgi:hypothetical protein
MRMTDDTNAQRQDSHRIRQWLFAVLRFAISLEQTDRMAALAVAAEMDRRGSVTTGGGFTFFVRTSIKLCDAVDAKDDPDAIATLRAHLRSIEHPPLRRAFEAVLELDAIPTQRHGAFNRSRDYLWKGLPARLVTRGAAALKPDLPDSE